MSMSNAIYISVRATQYTDRATRAVGRNISKMIKEQQALRRQMTMTFAAGMMYSFMAGIMVVGLTKIIAATGAGRRMMHQFERSVHNVTKSLGEQFLKILGPTIKMLTNFLNVIAKNEPIMRLIAALAIAITILVAMKGATLLLSAAHKYLNLTLLSSTPIMQAFVVQGGYTTTMMFTWAGAAQVLQASMGPMVMSFMLFLTIAERLGPLAKPILGVAAAIMILAGAYIALRTAFGDPTAWTNIGVMLAAAGAGMGAAAAVYDLPAYQYGTRLVQRTTPAIVHAGDVITRPDRGDRGPTSTQRPQFTKQINRITLSFGDIKTKADREELRPHILKILKEALNNTV